LDSHPDCRVSLFEGNAYHHYLIGRYASKEEIFAEKFRKKLGWYQRRGKFLLPGLLETTFEDAKIVGGEKAGPALTRAFGVDPDIVSKFSDFIEMPIKIVHHSRDPIKTMANRFRSPKYKRRWGEDDAIRAEQCKKVFSKFYDATQRMFDHSGVEVLNFRNEELCNSTEDTLLELCSFLGLESNDSWMNAVKDMAFSKPNANEVPWPEGFVEQFEIPWDCMDYYRGDHG